MKRAVGKLTIGEDFMESVVESGFSTIDITWEHIAALDRIPHHHRDPFDRLLIAQAWSDGLTIVTADRQFEPYGVPVVWV